MKEIPLTQGKVAIVDDDIYDYLMQWKWGAISNKHTWYAVRQDKSRKNIYMHRLIMDAPKGMQVDHINMNGLDNRRANLRVCTKSENMRNRGKTKRNTTGFKGVYRRTKGKYCAQISMGGKSVFLGTFSSPEDAAHAFDEVAKSITGSLLN